MLAGYLGNYSRYEIERKFILKELPGFLPEYYVDIQDLYLVNSSLRLRVEKTPSGDIIGRKLTKKDRAPDQGDETSVITSLYLSEDDFISLGPLTGAPLSKRRYTAETANRRTVYDVFQGDLMGLIMAEVEFKDQDSLSSYVLEDTSWEEVTGDPEYSGGKLAFSAVLKTKT